MRLTSEGEEEAAYDKLDDITSGSWCISSEACQSSCLPCTVCSYTAGATLDRWRSSSTCGEETGDISILESIEKHGKEKQAINPTIVVSGLFSFIFGRHPSRLQRLRELWGLRRSRGKTRLRGDERIG
jgi:hypothetical protein